MIITIAMDVDVDGSTLFKERVVVMGGATGYNGGVDEVPRWGDKMGNPRIGMSHGCIRH